MKKSIWKLLTVFAAAILLISLILMVAACSGTPDPWEGTYYEGKLNVFGNIMFAGKIEVNKRKVVVSENDEELRANYTVSNDIITLDTGSVIHMAENFNVLYLDYQPITGNFPARDGYVSLTNWSPARLNVISGTMLIIQLYNDGSLKWTELTGDVYGTTLTIFGNYTLNNGVLIFNFDYAWMVNSGASQHATFEGKMYLYVDKNMNVYNNVLLRDYTKFLTPSTSSSSTYTLTYLSGEGGYIQGNTNQTINNGGDGTSVTAVANEGYEFDGWSDGVTTATRRDTNVTKNITVTANFKQSDDTSPTFYFVDYLAGEGGYIEGGAGFWTAPGTILTATAIPYNGYRFVKWSDGVTTATRQDTVIEGFTVTALFEELSELSLTYSASKGGYVEGNTNQTVARGSNGSAVTAVANEGYEFVRWSDGVTTATRQEINVTKNIEVTALFEEIVDIPQHLILSIGDTCEHCGLELYIKSNDAVLMYNRNENYLRAEFYGEVADSRFSSAKSLTKEVYIGKNVQTIQSSAFYNYINLTEVVFEDGSNCKSIGSNAFYNCHSISAITLPVGVKTIGNDAFVGCGELSEISVPDTVVSIGYDAMWSTAWWNSQPNNELAYFGKVAYQYKGTMSFDTTITLREGTIGIADRCFYEQGFLREIKGYENLHHIGIEAFYNCISLRNLPISDCLESIDRDAFHGCISVEKIVISKSVMSIGSAAFGGCTNLKEVFYKGTADDWGEIQISSDNNLLLSATRYYFSEIEPPLNEEQTDYDSNYWHYDDEGNIVIWKKEN